MSDKVTDEERGVGIPTIFETAEGKGRREWVSLLTSSRRRTYEPLHDFPNVPRMLDPRICK